MAIINNKNNDTKTSRTMHIISIIVMVTLFIVFPLLRLNCFIKFWYSLKTFGQGIYYYFVNLIFDTSFIPETSYDYIINNLEINIFLPVNIANLGDYFKSAFLIAFNLDYFKFTMNLGSDYLQIFRLILTFLMMIILAVLLFYMAFSSKKDPKKVGNSKGLNKYLKLKKKFLTSKFYLFIKSFIVFQKKHKYYYYSYLFIIAFSFNLFSVILDFFGYYFLFVSTFNPLLLYYFVFDVIYTIVILIKNLTIPVALIVSYIVFDLIRKKVAKNKLEGFDNKNVTFVDGLGVATYIYGPPGCGKTKLMTDMVLSTDKDFRNRAFGILKKVEALEPNINYHLMRVFMERLLFSGRIDNRIQLSNTLRSMPNKYLEHYHNRDVYNWEQFKFLFGYDLITNKEIWDGIQFVSFDRILQTYSEAYYIYASERPLIYSNYAIRYDYFLDNKEYLKQWNNKLFDIDKKNFKKNTQYSMNIDFDELRLGNRYNGYSGMIDCGIVAITEIDKERGNKFNLEGLKRTSKDPNLKNDLFNPFWKLGRHPSTVDFYPFIKLFGDFQRPDSLNADLLDSGEMLLYIKKSTKEQTTLFFSQYSQIVLDFIQKTTDKILTMYKETRNYRSLFYQITKFINSKTFMSLYKREQIYAYKKLDLKITSSRKDDNSDNEESSTYYMLNKKIYANRYATDVYRTYFEKMFEKKTFKNNLQRSFKKEQFENVYPTVKEFDGQHSFLINDIEDCQGLKWTGENDSNARMHKKRKGFGKKTTTKNTTKQSDLKTTDKSKTKTNKTATKTKKKTKEKKED